MSSPRPPADAPLFLAGVDRRAAGMAVKRWHYSGRMPVGKLYNVGVWEHGQFAGVVVFGMGVGAYIGHRWGLNVSEYAELQRVALRAHGAQVSRIISIATKMLRAECPGLRLLVSFADIGQGHHGGIYQAAGWTYTGLTDAQPEHVFPNGRRLHSRTWNGAFSKGPMRFPAGAETVEWSAKKHRYVLCLDPALAGRVAAAAKPYPKRAKDSSEPRPSHGRKGGAAPTRTLQLA